MAVIRQFNALGQARVDVPHLRSVESAVAGDFDVLAGRMLAGNTPQVLAGFELVSDGVIQAASLQVVVADALLLHPEASESGAIFRAPSDRDIETLSTSNNRVEGSFTPSSTNYIGVDLVRYVDDTTTDLVQFLDSTTLEEAPENVPLGRTLDYKFVISTNDFAITSHVAPVATVVTDASNNVVSVADARYMMFRLGSGGGAPDPTYVYPWPGGRAADDSDVDAADKAIGDLKSWLNAAMTRMWELGGGERWFSPTADRNVTLTGLGGTFGTSGDYFEWDGADLHWQGLAVVFDNSTGFINEIADQLTDDPGLTDLADGECVYVDLDRTQDLTGGDALVAVKVALTDLGVPTIPGSRLVIAWRRGTDCYLRGKLGPIGASNVPPATTTVLGAVILSGTPPDPTLPIAGTLDSSNYVMAAGLTRNGAVVGAGTVAVAPDTTDDTALTLGNASMAAAVSLLGKMGLNFPIRTTTVPTPASGTFTVFAQKPSDRMQLCVKWENGVTLIIAESDVI